MNEYNICCYYLFACTSVSCIIHADDVIWRCGYCDDFVMMCVYVGLYFSIIKGKPLIGMTLNLAQ